MAITVWEELSFAGTPPRKFYDIAALEMENGPEVSGLKATREGEPLHTPSEPLQISVGKLRAGIKPNRPWGGAPTPPSSQVKPASPLAQSRATDGIGDATSGVQDGQGTTIDSAEYPNG